MEYIVVSLFLLFTIQCVVSKPSLSEMTALQSLYNHTNGNKWHWRPDYLRHGIPWNFTKINEQNPCNQSLPWQGVTCNKNESFITVLNLRYYNLNGKYFHNKKILK